MTVTASWLRGYSSSDRNRIVAPRSPSREVIAGTGTYAPAPGCRMLPQQVACGNCHSRGNEYGGPSADFFRIIPTAVCQSLRNQRSGFRTVPTDPAAAP